MTDGVSHHPPLYGNTELTALVDRPSDDVARGSAVLQNSITELAGDTTRSEAPVHELNTSLKEGMESRRALDYSIRRSEFTPPNMRAHPELPLEVLREVFEELALAVPAPYEHSPDFVLGVHSPWVEHVRFHRTLPLVCKKWWEPATRILYHHITLRRMGQITALARTLSAPVVGFDFSACVTHFGLHECGILQPLSEAMLEDLRTILRCCTALQSFSMVPHFNYGTGLWQWFSSSFDLKWMSLESVHSFLRAGPTANLRHLDMHLNGDSRTAIVELHRILSETPQLETLKLNPLSLLDMGGEPQVELSDLPVLSLPALTEFQFGTRCVFFTDWAVESMKMPKLTSLTCTNYDMHIPWGFLTAHGSRLTYLHFYPASKDPSDPYFWTIHTHLGLEQLSETCPLLEHFIIGAWQASDVLNQFNNATEPLLHLRYLDIWLRLVGLSEDRDRAKEETLEEVFGEYDRATGGNREKFPALGNNVRFLSYRGHSDLPKICHPTALADDEEFRTVCIRGVCVVQTSWCVRANEDFADLYDSDKGDSGSDAGEEEGDEEDEKRMQLAEDPDFVPESDYDEDATSWISEDASESESAASDVDPSDTWSPDEVFEDPPRQPVGCPVLRKVLPERWTDLEAVCAQGLPEKVG